MKQESKKARKQESKEPLSNSRELESGSLTQNKIFDFWAVCYIILDREFEKFKFF